MTKNEIGSLAYKLAGIFALIQATTSLPLLGGILQVRDLNVVSGFTMVTSVLIWFVALTVLVFGGVLLLLKSAYFATRTFKDAQPTELYIQQDVHTIAFSILGVALVCFALPGLADILAQIASENESAIASSGGPLIQAPQVWSAAVGRLIQLSLGIFLFVRGRRVTQLWYRLRGRVDGNES